MSVELVFLIGVVCWALMVLVPDLPVLYIFPVCVSEAGSRLVGSRLHVADSCRSFSLLSLCNRSVHPFDHQSVRPRRAVVTSAGRVHLRARLAAQAEIDSL